jgi:hypothetical protein
MRLLGDVAISFSRILVRRFRFGATMELGRSGRTIDHAAAAAPAPVERGEPRGHRQRSPNSAALTVVSLFSIVQYKLRALLIRVLPRDARSHEEFAFNIQLCKARHKSPASLYCLVGFDPSASLHEAYGNARRIVFHEMSIGKSS